MNGATVDLRLARPDEIEVCADVLGEAFADYPWTRFTVAADDHERRVRDLQRLSLELLGFDHSDVWVAEERDGVVGVAVFSDSRAPAPDSVVNELVARSIELCGDRLEQAIEALVATTDLPPTFPHVSLDVVGVRSGQQRRGIGAALIARAMAEADRQHLPVRLDTSTRANVAFYERLGFEVTGHVDLGGAEVWEMLRRVPRR